MYSEGVLCGRMRKMFRLTSVLSVRSAAIPCKYFRRVCRPFSNRESFLFSFVFCPRKRVKSTFPERGRQVIKYGRILFACLQVFKIVTKKHRYLAVFKWNVATTYPPGRRAERIEKIGDKRKRFHIMQINTPEGILYVFRGRFMWQNAEDVSLDVGFIRPFGGYTLQVLSAR